MRLSAACVLERPVVSGALAWLEEEPHPVSVCKHSNESLPTGLNRPVLGPRLLHFFLPSPFGFYCMSLLPSGVWLPLNLLTF
ncbi:hypothetical protein HaLaN_29733 [Haematococcus lacustris]|uniref:Uncharacterized protein n=1 Tax=Haematococcus lacustris TaxID=44745 RepID=A0A6A0AEV5_HAELA|nr:hypothetical protein HaLaN_29733 [Haematococcus lacustris]